MSWQYILGNIVFPIYCLVLVVVGLIVYVKSFRLERDGSIMRDLSNLCFIGSHPIPLKWVVIYFQLSRKEFLRLYDHLVAQLSYYNSQFSDFVDEYSKDELLDLLYDHKFGKQK